MMSFTETLVQGLLEIEKKTKKNSMRWHCYYKTYSLNNSTFYGLRDFCFSLGIRYECKFCFFLFSVYMILTNERIRWKRWDCICLFQIFFFCCFCDSVKNNRKNFVAIWNSLTKVFFFFFSYIFPNTIDKWLKIVYEETCKLLWW